MPGRGEGRGGKGRKERRGREEGEEGEGRKVRTPPPSIPAYAPASMCVDVLSTTDVVGPRVTHDNVQAEHQQCPLFYVQIIIILMPQAARQLQGTRAFPQ